MTPPELHEDDHLEPTQKAREWIDLKFTALRSEMRLLFVVAVAGNQILTHLSLGSTVGYIGGGLAATVAGVRLFFLR